MLDLAIQKARMALVHRGLCQKVKLLTWTSVIVPVFRFSPTENLSVFHLPLVKSQR